MIPDSLLQGRSELFKRSWLTGLAITVLVAQACGSDDGKKRVQNAGDGGAAGEAGAESGMDAAGAAGTPPVNDGGMGGTGEIVTAGGTGGAQEPPIPMAGAGGEAPLPPKPELLFSVKYGAHGLADTAISTQGSPENFIYTTSTASQDAVDGTNAVKVTGAALGLAETDAIVAFAEEQVEPKNPMFLFTIADGSEGAYNTRTYDANNAGTEEGKLYYSDSQILYDGPEGNTDLGYNGLSATETSLGLSDASDIDANPDDLRGLAVHDANKPLQELYFTVDSEAVGVADSGVDTVDSENQGCTLFKSALDGTNSVAFTCAELGLTTTDQIDALAIYAGVDGPTVVFSVANGSQGLAGTAVATVYEEFGSPGATLFSSTGKGTNSIYRDGRSLGLDEYYWLYDDLDGVAVVDQAPLAASGHGTCDLPFAPLAPTEGGLSYVGSTASVGDNVLVVFGPVAQAGSGARLLAYNATTCQLLQQKDVPVEFGDFAQVAIVPLAGWSQSKPLDKVEYFRPVVDGTSIGLNRYDAAGQFVNLISVSNTTYVGYRGLFYQPGADQLILVTNYNDGSFAAIPRPASDITTVDATHVQLTQPCAQAGEVGGVDSNGNVFLAQAWEVQTDFRVCGFRPDGEMLPVPYSWGSDVDTFIGGFVVPGGSHFLLHGGTTMWIERSDFPKL